MKLELDSVEVERFLTAYATHTLHIPSNRMRLNEDGSVTLWWEAPPPAPQKRRSPLAEAFIWWGDVLVLGPVWRAIYGKRS